MAENSQGPQGLGSGEQPEASPKDGDKQSLLLKLAERTVLQAEALAQEITDQARQESETEGAKLLEQYTERVKAEAQQTIESAQRQSETLLNEAAAEVLAESEKSLKKARSDSEKIMSKARSDSEKMMNKARSESEEGLDKAQTEGQEILGKARKEAQAIINSAQPRAESTDSNARLKAEFMIRQLTQNVSEGIRSAVVEICNNLLPAVEEFGKEVPEALLADQGNGASNVESKMLDNGVSIETEEISSSPEPAPARADTQSSGRSSAGKAKSSGKKKIAA